MKSNRISDLATRNFSVFGVVSSIKIVEWLSSTVWERINGWVAAVDKSPPIARLATATCLMFLLLIAAPACAQEFLRAQEFLPLAADVEPGFGWIENGGSPLALDTMKSNVAGSLPKQGADSRTFRPSYAVLNAELANWDADPQPDGWRCHVQLRNSLDGAVIPSNAFGQFELRLRVPRRERSGFNELRTETIRWSEKLVFDHQATAAVRLPLGKPLASFYSDTGGPSRLAATRSDEFVRRSRVEDRFREIRLAAGDGLALSIAPPRPAFGVMSVKVSVPGVGVLEAIDPVLAEEPLLVDSFWPQR